MSLRLIQKYAPNQRTDSIVDAGGGASTLAESLLKLGYGCRDRICDTHLFRLDCNPPCFRTRYFQKIFN